MNLTCISCTRMKTIFCFSSFIVPLFVHFFSEREANSEAFVLVVHAASSQLLHRSEINTRTHTCNSPLMTTAFLLIEVFSLSAVYFEVTNWYARMLWLLPGHFISRLFFSCFISGVHFHVQPVCYLTCFVNLKIRPIAAGCCAVKVGCDRGPLCAFM